MMHRIFISVIAVATLTAATIAWFASNDKVGGEGTKINSETVSNLVIATSSEALASMTMSNATFKVALMTGTHATSAVTHSNTGIDAEGKVNLTKNVCLKYLSNPDMVDKTTGKSESGFTEVKVGDNSYFVDSVVYIAALPEEMKKQTIKVFLSGETTVDTHKAFSVDVYTRTKSDGVSAKYHYDGTLIIKNPSESITIYNDVVPGNEEGYIEVLFRCYFDGALGPDNNSTYINSDSLDVSGLNVSASFVSVDSLF